MSKYLLRVDCWMLLAGSRVDPVEFMVERTVSYTQIMTGSSVVKEHPTGEYHRSRSGIHAEFRMGANIGGASSTPGRGDPSKGGLSRSSEKVGDNNQWTAPGDKRWG